VTCPFSASLFIRLWGICNNLLFTWLGCSIQTAATCVGPGSDPRLLLFWHAPLGVHSVNG